MATTTSSDPLDERAANGWCEDLLELLSRMGLLPFEGFGDVARYAGALASARTCLWPLKLVPQSSDGVGFGATVKYLAEKRFAFDVPSWTGPAFKQTHGPSFEQTTVQAASWLARGGNAWTPTLTE
jgi:hypothetical protein